MHEVPAGGHADLALVEKRAPCPGARGLVKIGVVEYDQRGVATKFEMGALEVASR